MRAVIGIGIWSNPKAAPVPFSMGIGIATAILLVICTIKGEPPRERLGK